MLVCGGVTATPPTARVPRRRGPNHRRTAPLADAVVNTLQEASIVVHGAGGPHTPGHGTLSGAVHAQGRLVLHVPGLCLVHTEFWLNGGAVDAVLVETLAHTAGELHVPPSSLLGYGERDAHVQAGDEVLV